MVPWQLLERPLKPPTEPRAASYRRCMCVPRPEATLDYKGAGGPVSTVSCVGGQYGCSKIVLSRNLSEWYFPGVRRQGVAQLRKLMPVEKRNATV